MERLRRRLPRRAAALPDMHLICEPKRQGRGPLSRDLSPSVVFWSVNASLSNKLPCRNWHECLEFEGGSADFLKTGHWVDFSLRESHQAVTRSCQGIRLPWPWKPRWPPPEVSTASIIGRRDQSIAV